MFIVILGKYYIFIIHGIFSLTSLNIYTAITALRSLINQSNAILNDRLCEPIKKTNRSLRRFINYIDTCITCKNWDNTLYSVVLTFGNSL